MMQANTIPAEVNCFICLEGNAERPFIEGPFCPNEGTASLCLIGIDGQVHTTGKHGVVHQSCLNQSLRYEVFPT